MACLFFVPPVLPSWNGCPLGAILPTLATSCTLTLDFDIIFIHVHTSQARARMSGSVSPRTPQSLRARDPLPNRHTPLSPITGVHTSSSVRYRRLKRTASRRKSSQPGRGAPCESARRGEEGFCANSTVAVVPLVFLFQSLLCMRVWSFVRSCAVMPVALIAGSPPWGCVVCVAGPGLVRSGPSCSVPGHDMAPLCDDLEGRPYDVCKVVQMSHPISSCPVNHF